MYSFFIGTWLCFCTFHTEPVPGNPDVVMWYYATHCYPYDPDEIFRDGMEGED